MPVYKGEDIEKLRRAGRVAATTLFELIDKVKPGVTTRYLDECAGELLHKQNAKSAPKVLEGFPNNICISVNEIVAHGLPRQRVLKCGDMINLDVAVMHDGFVGDVGYTIVIGDVDDELQSLCNCSKSALFKAIETCKAGTPINEVGRAMEMEARKHNYTILKNLCSHGLGKLLHEHPVNILNYYDEEQTEPLKAGMVLALEPYVSNGACRAIEADDGWSMTTHNNSRVAQFEHTILITDGKPEILTVLQ